MAGSGKCPHPMIGQQITQVGRHADQIGLLDPAVIGLKAEFLRQCTLDRPDMPAQDIATDQFLEG